MSNIILNGNNVVLKKSLWEAEDLFLAECMWFGIDTDAMTATADLRVTFRKAMYLFLENTYPAFWSQPQYKEEKEALMKDIDAQYKKIYQEYSAIHRQRLPWYDKLYKHQKQALVSMHPRKINFLSFQPRLGKAQPFSSEVLTATGWRKMADINIGDIVFDHEGNQTKVTGVFDQGVKETFKVTFSDKSFTRCCNDHLWMVQSKYMAQQDKGWIVKPLSEIREDIILQTETKKRFKWAVPQPPKIEFQEKELPLNPYLLGLLLGDGCLISSISFSTDDEELIPAIQSIIPHGMHIHKLRADNYSWGITPIQRGINPLIRILREMGLFNCRSHDKFIPHDFLFSSVEQRTALLQGLLDTDGHIHHIKGSITFSTCSPMIRDGIMFLVRSLGGQCSFGEDAREGKRTGFFMTICLPDDIDPVRLSRRIARVKKGRRLKDRRIVAIEPDIMEECRCISVDSPHHTYLTDNCIVTHNTITAASLSIIHNIERTVVITYDIGKWNYVYDMTDPKWDGQNILTKLNFTVLSAAKNQCVHAFDERFLIVNYESLGKYIDFIMDSHIPPGHIIISEAQKIKNHQSKNFKSVHKLYSQCPDARLTFETGTPVLNRTSDMYAYFKLAGHSLGENFADFKRQYSEVDKVHGNVVASMNIPSLQRRQSNFIIRRTQEECLDMPAHNYIELKFQLGEWEKEYRRAIFETMRATGKVAIESAIQSINRIMAISKVPGIIEHVEQLIDAGEKVIVYFSYTDPIRKVVEHFGSAATFIDGSVKGGQAKMDRALKFKNDPNCMVMVAQIAAAGHTVDLSISSNVILGNYPMSPKGIEQALDRTKNLDKKTANNAYFCTAIGSDGKETVDEKLKRLVAGKDSDINWLFDGSEAKGMLDDIPEMLWKELMEQYKNELNEQPVEHT